MPAPQGFEYVARKNGDVVISHQGRAVTTLRKVTAAKFLKDVKDGDQQELMARVTGDFKRGNDRKASRKSRGRDSRC